MGKYNEDEKAKEEEKKEVKKEKEQDKREYEGGLGDVEWSTSLTLGLAFHACQGAQTLSHHHEKHNGGDHDMICKGMQYACFVLWIDHDMNIYKADVKKLRTMMQNLNSGKSMF